MQSSGAGTYNSYAFLGVKAISTIDNKAEFNLMLSGAATTDWETVFSARYDSIYYWKVNSTSADITHHLVQVATTVGVWGWDDSGNGVQLEAGTGLTTTPAVFIGATNNHLCVGGQTDSSGHELLVLGSDAAVQVLSSVGNADIYITGYDTTDYARLFLGYTTGPTYSEIQHRGDNNTINIINNSNIAVTIDSSGYFFLPSIRNLTNTNYIRYNSGTGECTYLSSSDMRLKENAMSWAPDSLTFLMNQDLITFDRKDGSALGEIGWDGTMMEGLMPDMTWRDGKDYVNIKDAHFPFHFHRAIQQLGEKQETQAEKIIRLEKRVTELESQLN